MLKVFFTIFEPAIKSVINIVMANGIDFAWLLTELGLNFVEFQKTMLKPMNDYFLFFITLKFKIDEMDAKM